MRQRVAAPALAALAAVLVYLPAIMNGFATDDAPILANPLLQRLETLPAALASPWWWQSGALYRPLTLFTLGIDQVVGRGAPWLFHAVNVLLHALVTLQATRLYARFVPLGSALAAGVFFALLPVHVEAVATVVGRGELLAALCIATLLLLVTSDRAPTRGSRLAAMALSAAALASKEVAVVAPALVLAAAWTVPSQRRHASQWAGAALAGTVVMLLARFAVLGTLAGDRPHLLFRVVPPETGLAFALTMLPRAAAMLLLPVTPDVDYTPTMAEVRHLDGGLVILGALLVAGAAAAMVLHARRPRVLTLATIATAVALLPTANLLFFSGVLLSGRNLYAASLGSGLLVAAAFAHLAATRVRMAVMFLAPAVAASAALVTWREVPTWRSTDAVAAVLDERQPGNYRVARMRAYEARTAGRDAESLAHFRAAVDRFPADWEMVTDGAAVALRVRDTATAIAWLESAIAARPRAARARTRLADVLLARGDSASAKRLLREGLRIEPGQRIWLTMLAERGR